MEEFRSFGYKRQLWPHRSNRETFARLILCRIDFKTLDLPDSLFWLYVPLRPFLWAWRHLRDLIRADRFSAGASSSN
jgi:hypothetical protein